MAQAFDNYALSYDQEFTDSQIGMAQRARVWQYLDQLKQRLDFTQVLELNCGTGADARYFLEQGCSILATDISPQMVAAAARKCKGLLNGRFATLPAQKLYKLRQEEPFDLVFSNFGGLNCLSPEELQNMSQEMHQITKPGAGFVAVIMSQCCPWESLYFMAKGRFSEMKRRWSSQAVQANVGAGDFPVWYYSPARFASFFEDHFSLVKQMGVGISLPPSYLEPRFAKRPKLLATLNRMERSLSRFPKLASIGDHYLIHLKRKD